MNAVVYKEIDPKFIRQWKELWEDSPVADYTNSSEWFLSLIETFKYKEFAIIAIYNKNKLISVGGLVKEKKYGINFYTVAPQDFVCGMPFLVDVENNTCMNLFVDSLTKLGNVQLSNVTEEFVERVKQLSVSFTFTTQALDPYFEVQKNEKGEIIIPKKNRLTNRIRGMEDKFTVRTFDGTDKKGLETVFFIDEQSSKQEKGYSTFQNQGIKHFYINLAKYMQKDFLTSILYFEDKPIAYYIGFISRKTYYWSQNAFISEYAQYSPGKVLLVRLIDYLGKKNITTINFGSGDGRLKSELTDKKFQLYYLVISKNALIRQSMINLYTNKNNLYEKLHNNPKIYSLYCKAKALFKK